MGNKVFVRLYVTCPFISLFIFRVCLHTINNKDDPKIRENERHS